MFDAALHLKGYSPDLPTPFDADGAVNLASFARLCRLHIAHGVSGLFVCTATGESPTLTRSERTALIRCAVEAAAGRAAVIAGATANATTHACDLATDAEAAGAAAILSGTPYYNKPTQSGITAHFRTIAGACPLPIILHDEPGRSMRALADETVATLVEWPGIVGLCDATGDVSRVSRLRGSIGRDVLLLSGDDLTAPLFVAMGGDGCISGACTIVPTLCHALYRHLTSGDMTKARRLAMELAGLVTALSGEDYPAPLKSALARLGHMTDAVRLPLVETPEAAQAAITAALASLSGWIDHGMTAPTQTWVDGVTGNA